MKRILCTGGAGFLGSALCLELNKRGYEAVSYDLKKSSTGTSIMGDIRNEEMLRRYLPHFDQVFHLAAAADLNWARVHVQEAISLNVDGTRAIAKVCSELHIPLHFASTCCVYGNNQEHPSNEESICNPAEIYAITKIAGEWLVKQYHEKEGLEYNILRYGTVFGKGMRPALATHIFIRQALEGVDLTVHGSGEQTRQFIYLDDLMKANIAVVEKGIIGETVNMAGREEVSVLDMAKIILEETGQPPDSFIHVADRPGQVMRETIDSSKAMKLLDWEPKTGFREGIKRSIKEVRKTWFQ